MEILKKGQQGQKATKANVDSNIVECLHTSEHPSLDKGARFQLRWNFDFSKMSKQQILEAAAEHFLIKERRRFVQAGVTKDDNGKVTKVQKPSESEWQNRMIDPADLITVRKTQAEKIASMVATLSDEQLAALGLTRAE